MRDVGGRLQPCPAVPLHFTPGRRSARLLCQGTGGKPRRGLMLATPAFIVLTSRFSKDVPFLLFYLVLW